MGAKNGSSKRERQGLPPRSRARGTAPTPGVDLAPDADPLTRADALALDGVRALSSGRLDVLDERLLDLVVLANEPGGRGAVERTLVRRGRDALADRWREGWQPTDLHHVVGQARRHVAADDPTVTRTVRLLADLVADDLAGYADGTLDPTWAAQLDAVEATTWWPAAQTPVGARAEQWGVHDTVEAALRLEALLRTLAPLQQLGARPGQAAPRTGPARVAVDDRVLEKVRRLLAKAESTTFEAEAETFTAGAQALMARHSIDRALLAADPAHDPDAPDGRRLWLDGAYAREKVVLLAAVAQANRTRTVWAKEDGYVTLLGFAHDLDAVETLYTSLLVQGTRAMHSEGKRTHRDGASRTREFRASFLASFATRIGERLAEVTAAETARATDEVAATGRDLVPVLRERSAEVEAATERLFPELREVTISFAGDPEGWSKGRHAADRAQLGWGAAITS